jgi:YD repeat-containing protein
VFAYDTAANVTQITDPRGFVHTATYDAKNAEYGDR